MTTEVKRKVRSKEEWAAILSDLFEDEETTRKKLASLSSEEDWEEYWDSVLNIDVPDEGIFQMKAEERSKRRKTRRNNRIFKKKLKERNQSLSEAHESLYRRVSNLKEFYPQKPICKREKNFFLKMIGDLDNYQIEFDN